MLRKLFGVRQRGWVERVLVNLRWENVRRGLRLQQLVLSIFVLREAGDGVLQCGNLALGGAGTKDQKISVIK